jgi:thiol-disulfide isomerase/thioredoxin
MPRGVHRNIQQSLVLMKLKSIMMFGGVALMAAAAGFWLNNERVSPQPVASAPSATTPAAPSADWTTLTQATLKDLDGQPVKWDFTKGKVTVVNFWATWCAPCKEEVPDLVRLQREGAAKNVQVVGVGIDTPDKMRPFAASMQVNYPLMDASVGGIDLSKAMGNKVGALPFTLVFAPDGTVIMRRLGKVSFEDLKLAVGM